MNLKNISLITLILAIGVYVYARSMGIAISTSVDAFAAPARIPAYTILKNGAVEVYMDVTPAPWPKEAIWIYRLASVGIPVKVDAGGWVFIVRTVDEQGHLVIECRSVAEAQALLSLMS